MTNRADLKFSVGLTTANIELRPSDTPTYRFDDAEVYKLRQTYRGFPIGEGSEFVSVLAANQRAQSVTGEIIDQRIVYTGLGTEGVNYLTKAAALPQLNALFTSKGYVGGAVVSARYAALPSRRKMVWMAEYVKVTGGISVLLAKGYVDAVNGTGIGAISLRALESETGAVTGIQLGGNNPNTPAQSAHLRPVARADNTIHANAMCASGTSVNYRMGNTTEIVVADNSGGIGAISIPKAMACLPSDVPAFANADPLSAAFENQDMFARGFSLTECINPLMGEMYTAGTSHSYSWHHHPKVPKINHRSPLFLLPNSPGAECPGANGCLEGGWVPESLINSLKLPLPSGLVTIPDFTGNHPGENIAFYNLSKVVNASPFSMFHEIGHFYDKHNAYDTLGKDESYPAQCCLDRPQESSSLGETVANMMALYAVRKMYPGLSYTLSEVPGGSCNLASLGSHLPGVVLHQDCDGQCATCNYTWATNFGSNRPTTASAEYGCNPNYDTHAFYQAWWEVMFAQSCTWNGVSASCSAPPALPVAYADRWMESLLFALQVGNQQSYVQLWDNMRLYIAEEYPGDLAVMDAARAVHQIQPVAWGTDPVACPCPTAMGGCASPM